MSNQKINKKELKGKVVSNKMQNTVRVQVERVTKHPVYFKVINKRKVFFAHTDKELNIGDVVTIRECKPISKNVRWIVINE